MGEKSDALAHVDDRIIGAPDGADDEEASKRTPEGRKEDQPPGGYAELAQLWQRPWLDNEVANRRAFMVASQQAPIADILASARAWVAAADAPRYLPSLAIWLAACGWEHDPPRRTAQRRRRASTPRRGKVDLARLALAYGDDDDDDEADAPRMWGAVP